MFPLFVYIKIPFDFLDQIKLFVMVSASKSLIWLRYIWLSLRYIKKQVDFFAEFVISRVLKMNLKFQFFNEIC